VKCFRIAADQGDTTSEYHLSEMYFTGRGVPVDFCEALKWLRKAAEQGDAHAQYNLAAMYAQGSEVSGSGAGRRGVWPGQALALKPDEASYKKSLEKYEATKQLTPIQKP
jgi:TPR repeat protein